MCELLLRYGADVNARTRSGDATALHRAATAGQHGVVQLLLDRGADPMLVDTDGQTALHKVKFLLYSSLCHCNSSST